MERVLSPDEKLRRAEQIYYQKRGMNNAVQREKTVNVPVSNKRHLLRRMVIQIIICLVIYCTYYIIKNFNFVFSNNVINQTNQVLSYDIDIQDAYCKIANYIKNYEYFSNQEEQENTSDSENIVENDDVNIEETETKVETPLTTEVNAEEQNTEETKEEEKIAEVKNEDSNINQMQKDANDIKQKYSLINPLVGQITSRFGPRDSTEKIVSSYHAGLDIAANTGTVFVSSMEGEVVYSGELSGYGNCIQVQKDDVLIIYGHCNKLYVNKGDMVAQGQQIGEVGATGNATGPHLHFEIRKSGRYVDPELIL